MARREDVLTSIWEDEDFDRLSVDAALLYVWAFTNERCNMAGLYPVKERSILEGRLTPARQEAALRELADARFLFYADGWLWVRSRVRHLRTRGHNIAVSIEKTLEQMPPNHPLRGAFVAENEGGWLGAFVDFEELKKGLPEDPSKTLGRPLEDPSKTLGRPFQGDSLEQAKNEDPSKTLGRPLEGSPGYGYGYIDISSSSSSSKTATSSKQKQPKPDALPEGLPDRLVAAAEQARPILQRVAEGRGARPVTLAALGRAVESYPDRDHVKVASELEHWCLHGNGAKRPCKDVVARYRNFLDNSPPVARPEPAVRPVDRSRYDAKMVVSREVKP